MPQDKRDGFGKRNARERAACPNLRDRVGGGIDLRSQALAWQSGNLTPAQALGFSQICEIDCPMLMIGHNCYSSKEVKNLG
jgi:hypothetical protein